VNKVQAEQAATRQARGSIIATELEEENQFLVWAVKTMLSDGTAAELYIDAGSSEVLAVEESTNKDEDHEDNVEEDERD
jgi:uncharacterized membrane protein YkoI